MFTQCPDCERQFRVRADQLSAAAGEVKCGYCGSQFNALLRLRDQPVPPSPGNGHAGDPASTEPVTEETPLSEFQVPDNEPQFSLPGEPEFETDDTDQTPSTPQPDPLPRDDLLVATDAVDDESAEDSGADHDAPQGPDIRRHYDFPDDYLEETPQLPGHRSRVVWGLGSVVLLLILILQAGWFFRDRVLSQYPRLTPYVKQLCGRIDCRITRYPGITDIQLLNRDVRDHPRYEDSLLVNATMINRSQNMQPYPRIRLSLFDTNGKVISWRLFEPRGYLDDSIDLESGMNAGVPVHFVLEVTGPTQGAVSFEFDFLDQ